jgi:glycogen synthase
MKVLMLGWEFPPLFSGGLGVATYGIVKSLQHKVKIRLIIPTAGEASGLGNVNIIGLNRVTSKEVDLEKLNFDLSFSNTEIQEVPIQISPYQYINDMIEANQRASLYLSKDQQGRLDSLHNLFADGNPYGQNLFYKINLFATVCEELCANGDFDVIHAHDWVTFTAALRIKKRTGKPLILHVHALETDRSGENTRNEIYWLERSGLEEADRIILQKFPWCITVLITPILIEPHIISEISWWFFLAASRIKKDLNSCSIQQKK